MTFASNMNARPKSKQEQSCPFKLQERGFTLVVTLALMVLLAVIAVGLLSLSAVSLRSASHLTVQAEARANARLALILAIGELQKQIGPDQRISANGAITSSSTARNPYWTGVWDSWIAGPINQDTVNPNYPGKNNVSAHSTIAPPADPPTGVMASAYHSGKSDYFRSWLVSLNPEDASNWESAKSLNLAAKQLPTKDDNAIYLVGKGSLEPSAMDKDYVSARLIDVKYSSSPGGRGRYGWWVGDESQKARVMHDSYGSKPTANSAEKIYRGQSPGSTGTKKMKDLEDLTASQDLRLDGLPSMRTLDLVPGDKSKQPAKRNFHTVTPFSQSVLADVREGGLKRDLSVILEQPIDRANSGDEYMLYAFDDPRFPGNRSHSRVPIQDLAAYYQLYDDDPNWSNNRRSGVKYSGQIPNSMQTATPDYGVTSANKDKYLRQYTGMYTNPVPIKVQFLMGFLAEKITDAERTSINTQYAATPSSQMRPEDTHKLRLVVMPVVTLWNPGNLPVVMGGDASKSQVFRLNTPPFAFRWKKYMSSAQEFTNGYFNLNHAQGEGTGDGRAGRLFPHVIEFRIARATPVIFKPGEVKMFSVPASQTKYTGGIIEPVNRWDPFGFYTMPNSALASPPNSYAYTIPSYQRWMVFNSGDRIDMEFHNESITNAGRNVSPMNETYGGGFNFYLLDNSYDPYGSNNQNHLRNFQFMSRFGGDTQLGQGPNASFNAELMTRGFPGQTAPINFVGSTNAIPGSMLIGAGDSGEVVAFAEFSISAGCEIGSQSVGGFGSGRRVATRPFLHGSIIAPPFIDHSDPASLYDFGWDWQINRINNVEDSLVEGDPVTGDGYFGGGYNSEAGSTHVIQQEIPVLPSISIAALSHAHLSGYSLANDAVVGEKTDNLHWKSGAIRTPAADGFQRVTATGQGGLAPRTMQSLGNSYAHPGIPPNKALSSKIRIFRNNGTPEQHSVPYVDHPYLANKALWDEYFFSSMSPQPAKVELFGGTARTAKQVADNFFFGDGTELLPNRRMAPYKNNLNQAKLDTLFTQANSFADGLGDKIAAHLMVNGAFNVNSTSVEAWKVLFSSLRGKPVAYYESGKTPLESVSTDNTPVNPGMMPNAKPIKTADISSPNQPADQWKTGRELTDAEISQLAEAMVRQVKLRGPFLSMSEFINRRLDNSNTEGMALKGALQAALDDPSVSINANFRSPGRMLDGEVGGIGFAFPDAAKGPIAYGSQPYIDQADVLRGLAEQLTSRGDTFVIRTYGDSMDARGNVVARVWCEAVVQRLPDYLDRQDENHTRHSSLQSGENRKFGRTFNIVSFRWLNSNEV